MKIQRPLLIIIALALAGGLALSFGHKSVPQKPSKKIASIDCPTFDTTQVVVTRSSCGASDGSVVGLSAHGTGTIVYAWYNASGVKLSSDADLLNVPQGVYRVSMQDDSKCPAISLFYYIFENNSVRINFASAVITSPRCNAVDGSITDINITGATDFKWTDVNNKTIATTKDLKNVGPGTYLLTATDPVTGCISQGKFTVNAGANAPVITSYNTGDTDCGNTGLFHAEFDMKPGDPTFTWSLVNRTTNKSPFSGALNYTPAGITNITIPEPGPNPYVPNENPGLSAGTYDLITVGPGFCNTVLLTFTIKEMPNFRIDTSHMVIKTNVCGEYTGTILGLNTIGGPRPWSQKDDPNPEHGWFWYDSTGTRLYFKGNLIAGVPSGWYTVYAVNHEGCITEKMKLFLPDSVSSASQPKLNDVKMCLPGAAAIDVLNKDPNAHYKLYDSTKTLIDTSTAGYFSRKVNVTTTFYVQSVNGICGSPLGKVTITVVNPGVRIPNAFTPNNDGINDDWNITGLDHYPGTEVTVFNRNGQRVYHTTNYSAAFNGRYNGKDLPMGTYFFIIDTKKPDCAGGISGSLTILR